METDIITKQIEKHNLERAGGGWRSCLGILMLDLCLEPLAF